MAIKIGTAVSFKNPDSWENTPDDRQTIIKIIGDIYVEDNGVVPAGEVISCQAVFDAANWIIVKGYWYSRALVAIIDQTGNFLGNKRIVVRKYKYVEKHPKFFDVTLEFWGA